MNTPYLGRRNSMWGLHILVFAVFSNLTAFTVDKFGIAVLPLLVALAAVMLLFDMLTTGSYPLLNYRDTGTYVINFFFLIFMTIGLINADIETGFQNEIYPLLTGFIIYHLILLFVQRQEELDGILLIIVLCAPLLAVQGGYEFLQDMSAATFDYGIRAGGWWANPNEYALILNLIYLVSFYFLDKKEKVFHLLGYLAQLSCAAGIFISLSRGGILLFGLITLLGIGSLRQHKVYLTVLILAGLVLITAFSLNAFEIGIFQKIDLERLLPSSDENRGDYSNGRLEAAIGGLLVYTQHPLVGAGFGNIIKNANALYDIETYSHNMFIEILAIGGPLPFLAYLAMLVFLWTSTHHGNEPKSNSGKILGRFIIVLVAMGLFSHSLLYMKPFWVLLALFPIQSQLQEKKTQERNSCGGC